MNADELDHPRPCGLQAAAAHGSRLGAREERSRWTATPTVRELITQMKHEPSASTRPCP